MLALPLLRANGGNCLKPDEVAERPVRYRQRWRDVRNAYGEDTRQIAVMQPELTLRFAHQNNSDYLTCPVARLEQDSQGAWQLDETFLPPLLAIQGSRWLVTQLEQLMTQLRARLCRLMAMRRESNERMADFAVADVSLFWLLNARTQQSGVAGLNEGLAILEALISHQWEVFWPHSQHVRMEILSSLSQRLQQLMRMLTLDDSNLSELYNAEALLSRLGAVLQTLELKHLSQFETLRTVIHSNAARLEKNHGITDSHEMKPDREAPLEKDEPIQAVKRVYVVQQKNEPNGEEPVMPSRIAGQWKPFVAGMCSMLVVCVAVAWGGGFLS